MDAQDLLSSVSERLGCRGISLRKELLEIFEGFFSCLRAFGLTQTLEETLRLGPVAPTKTVRDVALHVNQTRLLKRLGPAAAHRSGNYL